MTDTLNLEPEIDERVFYALQSCLHHKCSMEEVRTLSKSITEIQRREISVVTQACIESILRRHMTGWVVEKNASLADYMFARAEEAAREIVAHYPPASTVRELIEGGTNVHD